MDQDLQHLDLCLLKNNNIMIKLIPKNQVLKLAIKILKRTNYNLHLTMFMKEEIKKPSEKYNGILRKKILDGVAVKRIGFGNKIQYHKAIKQLNLPTTFNNFSFNYSTCKKRHRFLIADNKEMLFAVYLTTSYKLVFYTRSTSVITSFLSYFKAISKIK